jgi:HPr kinase/phosphorylase
MINHPKILIHASTVAVQGHAVAITGASGSGKSSLALQLIALGAELIADDQTQIENRDMSLWASRPKTLPAKIEARGLGLLPAPMARPSPLALIVDLDITQKERMPLPIEIEILGQKITVWRKVPELHFPSAIFVYLSCMSDTPDLTS